MKYLRQFHRVTNAVKEIRIAEGDVLRPRGHLAPNVFEHHVAVDDSKHSLVNRYDWAMPAKMLASAARFRGTNDPVPVPGNDEMRILLHRRHSRSIRHLEPQSCHRDQGLRGLLDGLNSSCGKALRHVHELFFKFAAENRGHAERTKIIDVHGGV